MTVIIGFNWLEEVVMIADSRISWVDHQHPPQDILQKLYRVGDSNKSAVLGFCGDLQAAAKVMAFLVIDKLRNYKRPFVLPQFGDELRQWIEEVAISKLTVEQRTKIKFMLSGIEPTRHPPILKGGKMVGYTPFVESHIYIYTIRQSGKVDCDKYHKRCAVIGSGQELEQVIANKLEEMMRFGFSEPKLRWARAVVAGELLTKVISECERVSTTVGGPFQVVRITPNGLETHYIWPPNIADRNVDIQDDGSKIIVRNSLTKDLYVLYPIWKFPWQNLAGEG